MPVPQQIHRAVQQHHALALLLLRAENDELAALDHDVIVQMGKFEGENPSSAWRLPRLDFLIIFFNDILVLRDF